MNNWDKVKEELDITDITSHGINNAICKAILRVKQQDYCDKSSESCITCYKWLEKEYKPQILTDKEREYLSNIVRPFRDKVKGFDKLLYTFNTEWIRMITKKGVPDNVVLPCFNKGEYYKNMEVNKEYTLEELGL
jgi:hypothetical protein